MRRSSKGVDDAGIETIISVSDVVPPSSTASNSKGLIMSKNFFGCKCGASLVLIFRFESQAC